MSQKPHPPRPPPVLDVPCLNCSRFGIFPGRMICDAYNNTFCSPDCGWSYLLRPPPIPVNPATEHTPRKRQVKRSLNPTPKPVKEGVRRPPKLPQQQDSLCSSNAMFDYSDMMFRMDGAD